MSDHQQELITTAKLRVRCDLPQRFGPAETRHTQPGDDFIKTIDLLRAQLREAGIEIEDEEHKN